VSTRTLPRTRSAAESPAVFATAHRHPYRSAAAAGTRDAIAYAACWIDAVNADGELRDGAEICEITGLLPEHYRADYPDGTRFITRRERPHPGAQLTLFDLDAGWRHQVLATDTPIAGGGSIQYLEARHRGHARVEDRIRTGKDTGFGHFPSRVFAINAAWLQIALTGIDRSPGPSTCS